MLKRLLNDLQNQVYGIHVYLVVSGVGVPLFADVFTTISVIFVVVYLESLPLTLQSYSEVSLQDLPRL